METVVFLEAGSRVDPYSSETVKDDWNNPVTVLTRSMLIEPIAATEPLQDGRQAVIIGFRLYDRQVIDVDPSWRAQVRGVTLKVDGRPAQWTWGFTSGDAGTVLQVGTTSG